MPRTHCQQTTSGDEKAHALLVSEDGRRHSPPSLNSGYQRHPDSAHEVSAISHGPVASQTIGWVGVATQKQDKELFEDDRLASYREGELCGREDGVEYVCESILRGHRGELVYDIDRELVRQNEPDYGDDVILTLDVALQQRIKT
jgi:hypothetical protein